MKRYLVALIILANSCLYTQAQSLEKQANNPLANMTSLNFHNNYGSKLTNVPSGSYINTMWTRLAMPFADGKFLIRASVPITTLGVSALENNNVSSKNGLGDINAFVSYNFIANSDKTIGVGPLVSAPSATNTALGSGKWRGGLALVAFFCESSLFQYGGLVTWQKSFAGNKNRANAELLAVQPFAMVQLGKGYYVRSASTWSFDLASGGYNVPLSLGAGKVVKVNNVAFNFFIEPQYSVLHSGIQSQFQFNMGVNIQFIKN